MIRMKYNLRTSQCPYCFFLAPIPGFIGECPKCGKDTRAFIAHIRYNGPLPADAPETITLDRALELLEQSNADLLKPDGIA
jgi:hypothetical protein